MGLSLFVAMLVVADIVAQMFVFGFNVDPDNHYVRLFDLDVEHNLPSVYSAVTLAASAALFALIAKGDRDAGRGRPAWALMAYIFCFLSADELFSIHEQLIRPMRHMFPSNGLMHYGWVLPYGIATAGLGLSLIPFLRRLPARTSLLLLLSGAIYVSGAIGLEMVGAWIDGHWGKHCVSYAVEVVFEESLEMCGIVLLIYTLLDYIRTHLPNLSVRATFRD